MDQKKAEYAFRKAIHIAKRNEGSDLTIVNVINTRTFEAMAVHVERAQESIRRTCF